MKRIISLTLILAVLLSSIVTVTAAELTTGETTEVLITSFDYVKETGEMLLNVLIPNLENQPLVNVKSMVFEITNAGNKEFVAEVEFEDIAFEDAIQVGDSRYAALIVTDIDYKKDLDEIEYVVNSVTEHSGTKVAMDQNIKVYLDGRKIALDVNPKVINGRSMVPIRAISENLGGDIAWNNKTNEVTINSGGSVIVLTIGFNTAVVNGEHILLDAPAVIVDGRTLVPLRFVSEAMGMDIIWGAKYKQILIDSVEFEGGR